MRKTLIAIASLACLLWLPSLGRAQGHPGRRRPGQDSRSAPPSATPSLDFWALAVSNSDPQYASQSIGGVTGFGDYYITQHFGVEADFHCLALITSLDRAELTYLVGPRITLPIRNRFILYGKAMGGIRDLFIQEQQDNIGVPPAGEATSVTPSGADSTCNTARRSSSAPSITKARAGPDTATTESPPPSSPSASPIASPTSSCCLLRLGV